MPTGGNTASTVPRTLTGADGQAIDKSGKRLPTAGAGKQGAEAAPAGAKPEAAAAKTTENGIISRERSIVERMTDKTPVEEVEVSTVESGDSRIPNFKAGADTKTGEVEPLKGEPLDLVSNPIVVYEFRDGHRSVVTGRHRFQLYKRSGKNTIPARVIKEADGWTVKDAQNIDAVANIIDEKGTVSDYVRYFDSAKPTRAEAEAQGLIARRKGRDAFVIFEDSSPDTRSAIDWDGTGEKGLISPEQAAAISSAAPVSASPKNEGVQRVLVRKAIDGVRGKKLELLSRMVAAEAKNSGAKVEEGTQLDFFANEEGLAMIQHMERQADYRAKRAAEYSRIASVLRTAMQKGGKLDLNAAYAKELGISDATDRSQLAAARDKAVEKSNYWENAVALDKADKAQMDADIQKSLDAKAASKRKGALYSLGDPRDGEGTDAGETPRTTARVRVNPNLANDIHAAISGDANGNPVGRRKEVSFSDMPASLKAVGIPDLPIRSRTDIVRKLKYEHGFSEEQIAALPNEYGNPVAVFADGKSYIILTEMQLASREGASKPVMVVLRDSVGRSGKHEFLASAYPRERVNENFYEGLANNGGLMFLDKNKVAVIGLSGRTISTLNKQANGNQVKTPEDLSSLVSPRSISKTEAGAQGGDRKNIARSFPHRLQLPGRTKTAHRFLDESDFSKEALGIISKTEAGAQGGLRAELRPTH